MKARTVRPPQDVNILQPATGASIDLGVFTTAFADTLLAPGANPAAGPVTFAHVVDATPDSASDAEQVMATDWSTV